MLGRIRPEVRVKVSPLVSFVLRFAAILVVLGVVLLVVPEVQEPAQHAFAWTLTALLVLFGWSGVYREDVIVGFPGGGFAIGPECTALGLVVLVLAFVLAFPARASERVVGLVGATLVLIVANLVRLVTCAYVMRWKPDWFPFVHEYLWQVLLAGLTLAMLVHWAHRVRRPRP